MRLSGAVLSEGRFAAAASAYGATMAPGRRLARAFGATAAALGAQRLGIPGWPWLEIIGTGRSRMKYGCDWLRLVLVEVGMTG